MGVLLGGVQEGLTEKEAPDQSQAGGEEGSLAEAGAKVL